MKTLDKAFEGLPDAAFEGLPDADPFSNLPDAAFMDLPDAKGIDVPPGPVPDLPPLEAGSIPPVQFDRNALPPGMEPAAPVGRGATGTWESGATARWEPDPTLGQKAKAVGQGALSGLTAGTYQPDVVPGTEGYVTAGNIPGYLAGGAASALGGPSGVAGFGYLAFLNDLKARGLDPSRLTDPEIQAMAAAAGIAAEVIPASFGKSRLANAATGATLAAGQNVAQEGVEAAVTDTDPNYTTAGLLGAAMGTGVGLVHKPLPRRPGIEAGAARPSPEVIQVEALPAPDAAFTDLPDAPPDAFPDAAVEGTYTAQFEPPPAAAPTLESAVPMLPDAAFSNLPDTPTQKGGDVNVQEEGQQGRQALPAVEDQPIALDADHQNLAIRIARLHPALSEEQAKHQAWVIQRLDDEATARGAGEAVQKRAIEFDQTGDPLRKLPKDAPEVTHLGASVANSLSGGRGTLRVHPSDLARLGLQKGEALNPLPMNASEMWRVMGRPVKVDPNAPTLESLAEGFNEGMASKGEGVVTYAPTGNRRIIGGELPDPDNGYHADDLARALLDRPRSKAEVEEAIRAVQSEDVKEPEFPGQDERYLSGLDPAFRGSAEDSFIGPDGQPLFQRGAQQGLFGDEAPPPREKLKVQQEDMFGNEGRVAGQGPRGLPDQGLEGTPLQRRADVDEQAGSQVPLLQEKGKVTKGEIDFYANDAATLRVFTKNADFSTLMHESAHWARRHVMNPAEHAVVEGWLKGEKVEVKDKAGKWTVAAEERFARGFERYLKDGQAPNPQVKTIFEKIKTFMREVYAKVRGNPLGGEIPPKVREVFDGLLGFKREGETLRQEGEAGQVPPSLTPLKGITTPAAPIRFDVPDETRFDLFLRKVQDKMRPLKRTQRAISKAGGRVLEGTDAYLAEELYHGRAGSALRKVDEEHVTPLIKAMKTEGVPLKALDKYLYARHAKERNAQIEEINADPAKGSGMTDDEADAILKEASPKVKALAERVDKMNTERLKILQEAGLISEETRRTWDATYKHYVPLRGFEEAVDDPRNLFSSNIGQGFDIRGRESRRALGRESRADSPLAYSIAQMNEAIVRAEKNKVSKAFLKLVLDNPNPELWKVNKTEYKQVLEDGQVVKKQVVNRDDPHVVTAKVLGKEYYITVEDERLAAAMKNLGEEKSGFIVQTLGKVNKGLALINTTFAPEFVLSNFLRDLQTAGLNMAGENGAKFSGKVMKDVFPAIRGALQGIRDSQYLIPSKGVEEWTRWYKRFEAAGGKTEYLGLKTVEDLKNEFQAKLGKPTAWGKSKDAMRWTLKQVEDVNTAVENGVRLAAFKNAVGEGMSEANAASLAKNLTVNFNRKGELGTLANSLYLFFNANVQGSARLLGAIAKNGKLQSIAAGLAAASFGLTEWNRAVAGEDEDGINRYDKMAPFVKERNLVFMLPGAKGKDVVAYTIPVPYGYNVLHVVGQSMSDMLHGGDKGQASLNIAMALAGAFNPLGSESSTSPGKWLAKMATPTVADPLAQWAMNEDFTGAPVKPEQMPFGTPKPASQLAFKSVSPTAKAIAQGVNKLAGGSDYRSSGPVTDFSPETLEHFVTSYTGSLGKFIANSYDYAVGLGAGKDPSISKTPFLRRFAQGENEYYDQKTFAENANQYKPFLEEAKHLDKKEAHSFEEEFGSQIELGQMAQSIQKRIEKLNKAAKGIRGDTKMEEGAKEADLKEIEEEKRKLFREFNREVVRRKKKPASYEAK